VRRTHLSPLSRVGPAAVVGMVAGAVLLGLAIAGSLAGSGFGARRASAAARTDGVTAPSVVEEVRYTWSGTHVVEHRILIDTSVVADPSAAADQVAGPVSELSSDGPTAQYVLNPWSWPEPAMPISVSYNPSLQSPRPSLAAPIQNAVDQWSSATPATFRFVYGGTTSAQTGACDGDGVPDGVNTIAYVTTLQPGILGQTCTLTASDSAGGKAVLFEFDMQLNWTIDWGGQTVQPGQYDVFSTILHEMGHAAGLAHSCPLNSSSCTASDIAAVMYASLKQGVEKRALTQDDMDGLRALYPGGPPPMPPLPPFNRLFGIRVASVSHD